MNQDVNEVYASHTNGLPKTDFEAMRAMAARIIDNNYMGSVALFLRGPGPEVGERVLSACVDLENMLGRVKFNAFEYPEPRSDMTRWLEDMVTLMSVVYMVRSKIRQHDMPMAEMSIVYNQMGSLSGDVKGLLSSLVDLAQQKDAEYGASWCKRGGIGAWFTTVRKFDRLVTQVRQKGNNIWDVSDDIGSTEALEETIKDAINYLMLILEKRSVIHSQRQS